MRGFLDNGINKALLALDAVTMVPAKRGCP